MGPLLTFATCLSTLAATPLLGNNLLFLTSQGRYQEVAKELNTQDKLDEAIVEEVCLTLLRQGILSNDPEESILALFGASVALNEHAENLFLTAYQSPHPQIQLAALSMIARSKSESSHIILNQAIGAAHPLIRLEAAFLLAERRSPQASIKIESLMHKIDPIVHFLFPKLFAMIGDDISKKILQRSLSHPDEKVRTETILAIAQTGRDDLSRGVKRALSHPDALSKEAAAYGVGLLKDETAIPELEKLTRHNNSSVRVAALQSLNHFNSKRGKEELESMAMEGNLFAIQALSHIPESKETLAQLLQHPDKTVKANATVSLLKLKDKRALQGISDILIKDARDICYVPVHSASGALSAIKASPSAKQNFEDGKTAFEVSLMFREEVLRNTLELDNESFFAVAALILDNQQNDLVPVLMSLIENKGKDSEDFLKYEEQRAGAPYIRAWAALTLYRLKVEGNYEKKMKEWLNQEASLDLVKFRPFIPWELRQGTSYELTPNEKASLFISTLESFIMSDPDKAIHVILEMMSSGAGKNRFVLAGLLLRTIQ